MANSVTIRTTAPGATQAAKDLDSVKTSATGLGTAAKVAFTGIGVTAGAGFGLAAKGALQAQDAQGKFMAATGQSRDAAKEFVSGLDSLAGTAGAVGVSFDDITKTGITVAQQFGTTGQQTTDLTGKVLELAKVSGGNASDQAAALGDTLSGMGLDADAAAGLMDNLIASNQQFGTSIGDSITALDNMTPALTAMGLSLGDGQGLLNAFEQANVDATTASGDLTKAIKNLKPGQNIDDLIAQVGAIEDPVLRAQEATKLFGKSAGPDLAKVIQPGMKSLKDVELQAQNTGGALDGAANNMLTDSDKIQGVFDKLGAGARELGQNFGPAVTGLASLASLAAPFAKGIGSLLQDVATRVLPSATATGVAEGTAQAEGATGAGVLTSWLTKFGLMTPAKVAAAATAGTLEGTAEGESAATAAGAAFASKVPGFLLPLLGGIGVAGGAALGGGIALAGSAAITNAAAGDNSPVGNAFHPWTLLGHKAGTDVGTAAGQGITEGFANNNSAQQVSETFSTAISQQLPAFQHAGQLMGDYSATAAVGAFSTQMPAFAHEAQMSAEDAAKALSDKQIWDASAMAIGSNLVQGLKSTKSSIASAMDDLTYAIQHPLELEKEKAAIQGALTSDKLQNALASNNPEIRTQAEQTQQYLEDQWKQLTGYAWTQGNKTADNLQNSLGSNYAQIKSQARSFVGDMNAIFQNLQTKYTIKVDSQGNAHGGNPGARAGGGPVTANTPYIVGEQGQELFVPSTNGTIVPHGALGAGAPSQIAVHVNLSTRNVIGAQQHYATVQGGAGGFR